MEMPEQRLDRNTWLEQALKILAREGLAGVRVEKLARSLHVTKGSFYWHFKDRDDLFRGMLDYWADVLTDNVFKEVIGYQGNAKDRLLKLMEVIEGTRADRFEFAIRSWASHDKKVARKVRKVDEQRLGFIKGLFKETGFPETEADARARLFIYFQVAAPGIQIPLTKQERASLRKRRHKILTGS
jgi:AcrR family transcriptional regulator